MIVLNWRLNGLFSYIQTYVWLICTVSDNIAIKFITRIRTAEVAPETNRFVNNYYNSEHVLQNPFSKTSGVEKRKSADGR